MIVADKESSLILSGNGDVLEPKDGLMAIGSGGNYALAAARALYDSKLNAEQILVFDIATRYLMYHALGIFSIGILAYNIPESAVKIPVIIMFVGILLFSGSLYLISLKGFTKLGIITPIGGTAFIVSWVLLAFNIFKLP